MCVWVGVGMLAGEGRMESITTAAEKVRLFVTSRTEVRRLKSNVHRGI